VNCAIEELLGARRQAGEIGLLVEHAFALQAADQAVGLVVHDAQHDLVEDASVLGRQPRHLAEVDGRDHVVGQQKEIPRVRVCVEEA